jgi:hypothetical protein
MATRTIEGLRWQPRLITQLGCIKSCLEYLGREISYPWLYGGTGYAFVMNIHENLEPSGPDCWDTRPIFDLAANIGYKVTGISVEKAEAGDSFPSMQRQAWDFVRACLDRGLPCYGWELEPNIPGYNTIYGYDDSEGGGYHYSGWGGDGLRDWSILGEIDVQTLQVYCVELAKPMPDEKVVKDALATVIQHSATPTGWFTHAGYASGPAGFDLWAQALETGGAIRDGHSYNAAAWLECREMAVQFLKEALQRLPGRCDAAFGEAAADYTVVCERLQAALVLHPFHLETWDGETKLKSPEAAILLHQAGVAERQGLDGLQKIVAAL